MKYFTLFMLAVLAIGFTGCADDDDGFDPFVINYDGDNSTSPPLPIGQFEAAAYFPPQVADDYVNKKLVSVDIYIYDEPTYAEVLISEAAGNNAPGAILYRQTISDNIIPFSWNSYFVPEPTADNIIIENGLWLSMYFENNVNDSQIIGCDAGPGRLNGDWLFDQDASPQWDTYFSRTGESINWNIRGQLEDL